MKTRKQVLGAALMGSLVFAAVASADVVVTSAEIASPTIDLTAEGSLDWYSPGYNSDTGVFSTNQMTGADYISDITGRTAGYGGNAHTEIWSNGSPVVSTNGVMGQWEAAGGSSLNFSVDGLDAGQYQLMIHGTLYRASGTLSTQVTGGELESTGIGRYDNAISVVFDIENNGDSLAIGFTSTSTDTGRNVGIAAVTLQAVPEPAALGLIAVFGSAILFIRRRFMR